MPNRRLYRILAALALLFASSLAISAAAEDIAICNRVRFFPRAGHADLMKGGKFQGSNIGPTSDFTDLAEIKTTPPEGKWSELRFENKDAYKFLRYFGPAGSACNVSELEFYQGETKLKGKPFGTFGSKTAGATYLKVFDGDTNTFFDAPLPDDQYAGIELAPSATAPSPISVSSVPLVPSLPSSANARRHYHLGNSLTDTIGEFTHAIAKSAGYDADFFERSTIPGTPLHGLWNASKSFGTFWREGFVKFAPLDDVIFQIFIQNGDSHDPTYSIRIYDAARASSPNVRVWIYGQWASISNDKSGASFWEQQTLAYMPVYVMHKIGVEKARPEAKAQVIPGGLALINLKHAIEAGRVPGMKDFFASNFDDGIHLTAGGRYFIGLVTYSCLYGKSPVGLPVVGIDKKVVPSLTPEQAKVYQEIAWDTVTRFAASTEMVAAPIPGEIDARAHLRNVPPYPNSADLRYLGKGATFDYLLRVSQASDYQLRISCSNGAETSKPLEIIVNDETTQTAQAAPTGSWGVFGDTTTLTIPLKAGLNAVRLRVPEERSCNINSLKFTDANGGGMPQSLPMTDFCVGPQTLAPGASFTQLFTVTHADIPSDKLAVTVEPANQSQSSDIAIKIETGDFTNQWKNHFNRRLILTPSASLKGDAKLIMTITAPGALPRQISFTIKPR